VVEVPHPNGRVIEPLVCLLLFLPGSKTPQIIVRKNIPMCKQNQLKFKYLKIKTLYGQQNVELEQVKKCTLFSSKVSIDI
jgi:hypothetical protein